MASLKLYLDDCAYSRRLRQMLLKAGHQVVTPFEADTAGADDPIHFEYACQNKLIIVTKDPAHFEELYQDNKNHSGIFAIYEEADRSKNMSYADIVRAINNLAVAELVFEGEFFTLNHWQW